MCRRLDAGASEAASVSDGAVPEAAKWRPEGEGGPLFPAVPGAGWQPARRGGGNATLAKVFGALVAVGAALALLGVLYAQRAAMFDAIQQARARCRCTTVAWWVTCGRLGPGSSTGIMHPVHVAHSLDIHSFMCSQKHHQQYPRVICSRYGGEALPRAIRCCHWTLRMPPSSRQTSLALLPDHTPHCWGSTPLVAPGVAGPAAAAAAMVAAERWLVLDCDRPLYLCCSLWACQRRCCAVARKKHEWVPCLRVL